MKAAPPQNACVCSLINMLSCGFVFGSSGLIAANAVCINKVHVQCVQVCALLVSDVDYIHKIVVGL